MAGLNTAKPADERVIDRTSFVPTRGPPSVVERFLLSEGTKPAPRFIHGATVLAQPKFYDYLEVDELPDGKFESRTGEFPPEELPQWLDSAAAAQRPVASGLPQPRLRLLIHYWETGVTKLPRERPIGNSRALVANRVHPFADMSTLKAIIEKLNMPRQCVRDFRTNYTRLSLDRPRRVGPISTVSIHAGSPKDSQTHLLFAITHTTLDAKSNQPSGLNTSSQNLNVVTGFLAQDRPTSSNQGKDVVQALSTSLKAVSHNPMLYPLLMLWSLNPVLESDAREADRLIDKVQKDIGLVDPSLLLTVYSDQQTSADEIHGTIVSAHASLTRSTWDCLIGLQADTQKLFDEERDSQKDSNREGRHSSDLGRLVAGDRLDLMLRSLSSELDAATTVKDMVFKKIDLQLQVLHHLMQRHDALRAIRDGSQMKAIALLTTVFLPTTALATIFSMAPFFASDDDGSIVVTPKFWIFWVVAIPLTIGVLAVYTAWIQRRDVMRVWSRMKDPKKRRPESEFSRDDDTSTWVSGSHRHGYVDEDTAMLKDRAVADVNIEVP